VQSIAFWVGFNVFVLAMLALDLGVFHRKAHVVSMREAAAWVSVWVSLALVFSVGIYLFYDEQVTVPLDRKELAAARETAVARGEDPELVSREKIVTRRGIEPFTEFITGYVLEQSLSMDNVFVIAMIFGSFGVPPQFQHRVLFYGILGVLIMRGVMIVVGAWLIAQFAWVLYVFGAFLLFTGIKMMFTKEADEISTENHAIVKFVRRFIPLHPRIEGQKFFIRIPQPGPDGVPVGRGKLFATPLFIVLLIVEFTDLIFALDSIPAIFGVTKDPFIVYTSNVFAILGLRSMYFLLAGAMGLFRYLKLGLSLVLIFVGLKMMHVLHFLHLSKTTEQLVSFAIIFGILGASIVASLIAARESGDLARLAARLEKEAEEEETQRAAAVESASDAR
jgi:tellurite resistance protein TerC